MIVGVTVSKVERQLALRIARILSVSGVRCPFYAQRRQKKPIPKAFMSRLAPQFHRACHGTLPSLIYVSLDLRWNSEQVRRQMQKQLQT